MATEPNNPLYLAANWREALATGVIGGPVPEPERKPFVSHVSVPRQRLRDAREYQGAEILDLDRFR